MDKVKPYVGLKVYDSGHWVLTRLWSRKYAYQARQWIKGERKNLPWPQCQQLMLVGVDSGLADAYLAAGNRLMDVGPEVYS